MVTLKEFESLLFCNSICWGGEISIFFTFLMHFLLKVWRALRHNIHCCMLPFWTSTAGITWTWNKSFPVIVFNCFIYTFFYSFVEKPYFEERKSFCWIFSVLIQQWKVVLEVVGSAFWYLFHCRENLWESSRSSDGVQCNGLVHQLVECPGSLYVSAVTLELIAGSWDGRDTFTAGCV